MVRFAVPVLVMVTVCGVEMVLTATLPKASDFGLDCDRPADPPVGGAEPLSAAEEMEMLPLP